MRYIVTVALFQIYYEDYKVCGEYVKVLKSATLADILNHSKRSVDLLLLSKDVILVYIAISCISNILQYAHSSVLGVSGQCFFLTLKWTSSVDQSIFIEFDFGGYRHMPIFR